ncbi:MAG: cysteine hydrolase [Gammaproteobacteria bacterium]|nr:cysteine hydrolase [Gammaproteobacteria bacterium]
MKKDLAALLLMDFQVDVCDPNGKMLSQSPEVVARFLNARRKAAALLTAARSATNPPAIVHIQHLFKPDYPELANKKLTSMDHYVTGVGAFIEGSPGAEIVKELQPIKGEQVFRKHTISPFVSTDLDSWLKEKEIKILILTGVVTHYVVLTSALAAQDMGYKVIVVKDCCTSGNAETHDTALAILSPIAELMESTDLIKAIT